MELRELVTPWTLGIAQTQAPSVIGRHIPSMNLSLVFEIMRLMHKQYV